MYNMTNFGQINNFLVLVFLSKNDFLPEGYYIYYELQTEQSLDTVLWAGHWAI